MKTIFMLRTPSLMPEVKKVFVRSGVRFDYALADPDDTFIRELCERRVSGQLKVAPEHVSDAVLSVMGKPGNAVYERFRDRYARVNADLGKKQYLVPYLMSSHPGSTLKEAVELAEYAEIWDTCRSRCRISTPRRPPCRHACITPE